MCPICPLQEAGLGSLGSARSLPLPHSQELTDGTASARGGRSGKTVISEMGKVLGK